MRPKLLYPFVLIAAVVLVVSMACITLTGESTTGQPQEPVQTEAPVQTDVPAQTEAPVVTEAPTMPQAQKFFTEEFDSQLSGNSWSTLTVKGNDNADPDKVTLDAQDGKLVWNFDSKYVYYYLFYEAYTYDDVRLEVRADNRGKNNNSISLICRYDPKIGWYEFNIANNGLYSIAEGEVTKSGKIGYHTVTNGGSLSIKQGKDVNEYAIVCKGTELSLFINGDEVKTLNEKKYALREGKVGISVSSFNVLPITIEMDWLKIIEP
jgi:hypothetical protein